MRRTVFIINALASLMLVAGIARMLLGKIRSDAAGQGMAGAYVVIGSIIALVLGGIAYTLASNGQVMWLAIVLAIVSAFFALVALVSSQ